MTLMLLCVVGVANAEWERVYRIDYSNFSEIQEETEAFLAEVRKADSGNETINEAAYQRLSAEIADIKATYNTVYAEFIALAQINGQSWAASFGNKLGGIQVWHQRHEGHLRQPLWTGLTDRGEHLGQHL